MEPALELEHAIGYSTVCGIICWHPNGKKFLYAAGASVVISDLVDPHDQIFLRGHDAPVTCLTLSASGRLAASGQNGANSDACVWDYEAKQLLYRLSEHDHGVVCLAFSHDEKLLCTCGVAADNKALVWDMSNGYIVAVVQASPSPTTCVCWGGFVRDIKRRDTANYQLCTAGNKQVVLWNLDPFQGELEARKVVSEGRGAQVRDYTHLAFSDDLETVYAATTSGDFVIIRVKSASFTGTVPVSRQGIHALAVHRGGLLVGGGDGTVTHLEGQTMHETHQVELQGPVVAMSFSPDKIEVMVGTADGFIYRLRTETLQSLLVCENHSAGLVKVGFSKDASDRFATLSMDCTVRVWDAADYSTLASVTVRDAGTPACLTYTLDYLLTGWSDGKIRAHEAETGHFLWHIDNAHTGGGVTAICLSNNERFILTGGVEGEVRVWEMRSRELVSHLKEHTGRVSDLKLYDDDVHALSCGRDRAILCWDLRSERRVSSHVQRMGGMNALAVTKDQTLVLTVGQEKRVTKWDLRDHSPVSLTDLSPRNDDEALAVAVSSNGLWVATAGTAQLVKIWDMQSMRLVSSQTGHSGTVVDLKFSPDDKQLVSVGTDGLVLVWNIYA